MTIRIKDVAGLDFSDVAGPERIGPVTPGEVLREEFMMPLGLFGRALAREPGVPSNRVTEILPGQRFGTSAEFWLNLQMAHDLEKACRHMGRAA